MHIYVDADACPVKEEIYKVAGRYKLDVTLVANGWMRTPKLRRVRLAVVSESFDAADDWIVARAGAADIVITADIPLAARCIENGAAVLSPTGKPFTEEAIGDVLASRNLMNDLREAGVVTGGPPPFSQKERSRFLQELDRIIQMKRRE